MKKNITFKKQIAIVSTQFLAILLHGYLTYKHYHMRFGYDSESSLCNFNSRFNCDTVNLSHFAKWFDIPVSLYGMCFNIFLLWILLSYFLNPKKIPLLSLAQILSGISLLTSIGMSYISIFELQTYCVFCFIIYALSIITFVLLILYTPLAPLTQLITYCLKWRDGLLKTALIGTVATLGSVILLDDMIKSKMTKDFAQISRTTIFEWSQTPRKQIDYSIGLHKGAEISNAKMRIAEFADFECSHCASTFPMLKRFINAHPEHVALIFFNFPLDGCKGESTRSNRCKLAQSVYCAEEQNHGWVMHDWLFNNFQSFSWSELQESVKKIGLNSEDFERCHRSDKTKEAIMSQIAIGKNLGVQGTPTIFINERKVLRGHQFFVLEEMLKHLLAHPDIY